METLACEHVFRMPHQQTRRYPLDALSWSDGWGQVGTWLGLAAEDRVQTCVQTRMQRAAAAARGWKLRVARGVRRVLASTSMSSISAN